MVASAEPYSRKGFASPHGSRCHTVCHTFHVCHTRFNAIGVSFLIPHVLRSPIGVGGSPPARRHGPHGHRADTSPRALNGTCRRMEPDTHSERDTGERHGYGVLVGERTALDRALREPPRPVGSVPHTWPNAGAPDGRVRFGLASLRGAVKYPNGHQLGQPVA